MTPDDTPGSVPPSDGAWRDGPERQAAEEPLATSHDLLVKLARLVPGVIYQYRLYPDGRSRFPYSSPEMSDIYEVTPEEVQEDATPVFGRLHPDDARHVADAIQESARSLTTFYCEFRVVLPRQGLRWRWSQAHPERTADGGTLWHGIILDTTDRKLAEAEKAALEEQLRQSQKMESVGRLAGGVAHDFNNMLGVILGHTDLVLRELDPDTPLRDDLLEIQRAAERSADLTRQLLAFARRQTIMPRALDLNDAVEAALSMLRRMIGESIELAWRPAPGLWLVHADPSQIDQILANLCVNARDAIADVGRVTIETGQFVVDDAYGRDHAGCQPGEYVKLAVSDDGCGMDTAILTKLFEPFFTTKETGKGTGLGLATVYGIVKQNGGFIDVRSEPGRGSTFSVFLPRHAGQAAAAAPADVVRPPAAQADETILLVEDETAFLRLTRRMLETLGYTVLSASTPGEALRLAGEHPSEIHLLITDVIMPQMNGRDLAAHLMSRHPRLRCLFMSGYTADVIAHHGVLDAGVQFIQKPYSLADLTAKVRQAIDGRR